MSEKKTDLYKAIGEVMKAVKGVDKALTVGKGQHSYKGVSDKDVKLVVGEAMQEHGLIMIPKSYDTDLKIERWEAEETWNGKNTIKQKQSVFVECKAVYELIHTETGQSLDIPAYGHGIDAQDKSAGKATTYAMKTALLYTFLVPTGAIDDTDKEHSNDKEVPKKPAPKKQEPKKSAPKTVTNENLTIGIKQVQDGDIFVFELEEKLKGYELTKEQQVLIDELKKNQKNK